MTEFTRSWSKGAWSRPALVAGAVLSGLAALPYAPGALGIGAGRPNWALLAQQGLAIQLHLAAAISALLIGTLLMAGVKGRTWHKRLGWSWVIAMLAVAVTTFWIREIRAGDFSWIHALSGWVLVVLPAAVYAARRKRIRVHRRIMTGLFYAGLILAGMFAFMPGRVLWPLALGYD